LLVTAAQALAAAECAEPLPSGQLRLQVAVQGVKNTKGNITITVYPDDARQFLAKGGKLARQRVPALAPLTQACFQLPAAAHYAIAVYHDADDDHDLDRNLFGLPSEGGGFSNNPQSLIGLPSLDEVRFATQPGETRVNVQLKY
jgi:uncharacterized protein (DUF2141 family)